MFIFILALALLPSALSATVTVNAHYPRSFVGSNTLFLRGSEAKCGLNWDKGIKMSLSGASTSDHFIWTTQLSCDAAVSNLEVKVLINDAQWMLGGNHHISLLPSTSKSSSKANTTDIVASKTTITDDLYPWFYTYQGSTSIISSVYSPELKNFRDVIIYTPPSYLENTLKIHENVLIMHDGQNLFNPATFAFGTAWKCQDTLDGTIIQGSTDEVLIIGPYNTNDRTNEYTYIYDASEKTGGKGDLYLDWLESTLLPLIQSKYRITINHEKLGILGSSLGGLISCYAGWTRSKVYCRVGCMSSSFWWDDNDYQHNVITSTTQSTQNIKLYLDSGTEGGDGSCAVYTGQVYDYYVSQQGYVETSQITKYVDVGGSHNEASWGARFYLPMQMMYPSSSV